MAHDRPHPRTYLTPQERRAVHGGVAAAIQHFRAGNYRSTVRDIETVVDGLVAARKATAQLRGALTRIMALSLDRERFVLMGPRAFIAVEEIARTALRDDLVGGDTTKGGEADAE